MNGSVRPMPHRPRIAEAPPLSQGIKQVREGEIDLSENSYAAKSTDRLKS